MSDVSSKNTLALLSWMRKSLPILKIQIAFDGSELLEETIIGSTEADLGMIFKYVKF